MTTFSDNIRDERERRMKNGPRDHWTQKAVAKRVGMSLRAYQGFEAGDTTPQPANLRRILAEYEMEEQENQIAEATRASFPPEVQVFLDAFGAYLMTMDEPGRLETIGSEFRRIFDARQDRAVRGL